MAPLLTSLRSQPMTVTQSSQPPAEVMLSSISSPTCSALRLLSATVYGVEEAIDTSTLSSLSVTAPEVSKTSATVEYIGAPSFSWSFEMLRTTL